MPLLLAYSIVGAATAYLIAGVFVAIPFVTRWVVRVDPAARDGTAGFRILIFPGAVLLWPLLLGRVARSPVPPE